VTVTHDERMTHMKRIIATGSVAALALVGFAGTASAAPSEKGLENSCFGQIHKAINVDGALGLENVGQLVQTSEGKGQGKNMAAKDICAG